IIPIWFKFMLRNFVHGSKGDDCVGSLHECSGAVVVGQPLVDIGGDQRVDQCHCSVPGEPRQIGGGLAAAVDKVGVRLVADGGKPIAVFSDLIEVEARQQLAV